MRWNLWIGPFVGEEEVRSQSDRVRAFGPFAVVLALLGAILACGSPTKLASINLHGERVNEIVRNAALTGAQDGWSFEVERAELHDSFLRLYGNYQTKGGESVPGSLDLSMDVQEEALVAAINGVDFPGETLTEEQLQQVSSQLAQSFTQAVSQGSSEVTVVSVKTTEVAVLLAIRFVP
jgi:hypothetical protein